MAHLFQINLSKGGVPKTGHGEAAVGELGLEGDAHVSASHGGPSRALCLYSLERILALQAEGHSIFPGSTGENLTICGLEWERLEPGTRLRVGPEVEIEITSHTSPCSKIEASFKDGAIERMAQETHPGWARLYARVLRPGRIRIGDPVAPGAVGRS